MKKWSILFLWLTLYTNNMLVAKLLVIDKIVAIVNNDIILKNEVDNALFIVKYNAQKSNKQLPNNVTLRRLVIDQLIMNKIILQIAKQENITINDKQVDQVISNIKSQNNISRNQHNHCLICNNRNSNTYREQIRKKMLITKVRNELVSRRITILPQEVNLLAQQIANQTGNGIEYNISQIIIPLPEKPKQEQLDKAKILATSLVKQSKNGVNFDKLVIKYSTNNQVLTGGEMGWWKLEKLPSILATHLQNAQKNSIIGQIRSGIGFHILKVNDIRDNNQRIIVNEIHARHILLHTSVLVNDQQAQRKLAEIAAQIKNGHISFVVAAKQFSQDLDSADQGGDLGWNLINAFDLSLRNTLTHLKKGEISGPVRSSLGWHLFQLINTRQVDHTDIIQKERAYRLLFDHKFIEEAQIWMQEQRASTYVKIIDSNE